MNAIGNVTGITANLVTVRTQGAVAQNEICYLQLGPYRLMGEVIKVRGDRAFVQVFESTRGLKTGNPVRFTGNMLEVHLGPGMLNKKYDGLQNDLDKIDELFLERGVYTPALDEEDEWEFTPLVKTGMEVAAGDWLGEIPEHSISHKVMAPFELKGHWRVDYVVPKGKYKLEDTLIMLKNQDGEERPVGMAQKWPIKRPLTAYRHKLRPGKVLQTGIRAIDSMSPMAEGGTGFIPGPFGSGKTILQHSLSQNARTDVIIFAACGERANEIVGLLKEFEELEDPRTGHKLMERLVLICNTSNMPVAAREASVYTAMTIAEYYRLMGLRVLLLADSTSRWAQAMREMSNRLEELPGPDAYPMDLTATIANYYARAGRVELRNHQHGSVTFIGTVSPAGGNLKEPVTEATKKAARCYYALSQQRADRKRYPAIEPVESYSKYLEYPEVTDYLNEHLTANWTKLLEKARDLLLRGREAAEQINILGDDGVPIAYHETYWKAEMLDFVILQQDAFDDIDKFTPLDRQQYMLERVMKVCDRSFKFSNFEEVRQFFQQAINLFRQMNYSSFKGEAFQRFEQQLDQHLAPKEPVS
ncbi:MAG: V-type ATP synthase subunit A [Bacteroidota bacterium]